MAKKEKKRYKRYQYFTKDGIAWTDWFLWTSDIDEKWQVSKKLKNEYKEE